MLDMGDLLCCEGLASVVGCTFLLDVGFATGLHFPK